MQKKLSLKIQPENNNDFQNDDLIIQTAIDIEKIIIEEFQIKQKNIDISKLYFVRRNFIEKKVLYNKNNKSSPKDNDIKKIIKNNAINDFTISMHIFDLLHNCKNHTDLDILNDYLSWHYQNHLDRFCYLFSVPLKTDPLKMFDFEKIGDKIQSKIKTKRDGFKFIKSFDKNYAIMHAHYCILCHKTKKDSCRFGLKNLSGCPLDQKISIINFLYKNGHQIAALYVMLIDNPIPLLTGHRICNDCEKSCIFQKQTPVDVPAIESQIIEDILSMPYGFEIYDFLSKNQHAKTNNANENYSILVVGLGPAGIALSYYLLNLGYTVVAIDGTKIEDIKNIDQYIKKPIYDIYKIADNINNENKDIPYGFGGVSEYGITNRWDKRLLHIIRIMMERKKNFHIIDGVRFGHNIDETIAFERFHFDHIALAIGAKNPNFPDYINNNTNGIYTSNDFLMHIHKQKSYMKPIETPIIIIGAGLSAVDCAMESLYFYIQTNSNNETLKTIQKNSKVQILYHKTIQESKAYRESPKELEDALSNGVTFTENTKVIGIEKTETNSIKNLLVIQNGNHLKIKCNTLIIATGIKHQNTKIIDKNEFIIKMIKGGKSISSFGDFNPKYVGSVVKAIKSAKDGYKIIDHEIQAKIANTKKTDIKKLKSYLLSTVYKIDCINKNQFILKVKSKLVAQKIKIGQICKVQGYKNFHTKPIVLTCVSVSDDIISFVITKMTIHTAKIFNMKPGDKIALLGPIGNHIPDNYKNYTFIIDNEYKMVANEIIKQKPFTNAKIISHDDIGTKMNPDCIILWTDKIVDIKSVYKSSDIYFFMTKNMHCMMGGICGKCMYKDQNQNTQFGCNNHIIKI